MSDVFGFIAIAAALWGVVSMIRITTFLEGRGRKINYFLIRLLIFRYISDYKAITEEETGRPGPIFYHFVIAMNTALVLGAVTLMLR